MDLAATLVLESGNLLMEIRTRTARLNEVLVFLFLGEFLNHLLDFLRLALVGEHGGVVRLDEDGIAQTDNRDRSAILRASVKDDVAGGIDVDEISDRAIAFRIGFKMTRQRGP